MKHIILELKLHIDCLNLAYANIFTAFVIFDPDYSHFVMVKITPYKIVRNVLKLQLAALSNCCNC